MAFIHKSPLNLLDNQYLELFTLQSQLYDIYKRKAVPLLDLDRDGWILSYNVLINWPNYNNFHKKKMELKKFQNHTLILDNLVTNFPT